MTKQVALITGASSGIGFATAVALKKAGYTVYGAARRLEKLEALRKYDIHIVSLDVTDDTSMEQCIKTIFDAEGRIIMRVMDHLVRLKMYR